MGEYIGDCYRDIRSLDYCSHEACSIQAFTSNGVEYSRVVFYLGILWSACC